MGIFDLDGKDVHYAGKRIRANSVNEGDVIALDNDRVGVVLNVTKTPIVLAEDDEATVKLLEEVKAQGSGDKVSPNFDETVAITVVSATFEDEGKMHLHKEVLHFPEWGLVISYV